MPKYLLPNKSLVSHSLLISRYLSIRSLLPYASSSKGFYIILYYIISYHIGGVGGLEIVYKRI